MKVSAFLLSFTLFLAFTLLSVMGLLLLVMGLEWLELSPFTQAIGLLVFFDIGWHTHLVYNKRFPQGERTTP